MTAPHDAPNAMELLEAVREWIDHEVIPATDGRLRFHARVASNVLGMVEREIELGPAQEAAHRERLARLGVADDAELAAAIRARRLDDRADEVRTVLAAAVADKLAVANPTYG
ncbi:MAG TPA: DUF6285 domain-containing protein [Ilumatobacteraceae bacterium]|nr:DUF6285 domain-containing protein [Ilumatobacteraceae bacterium]